MQTPLSSRLVLGVFLPVLLACLVGLGLASAQAEAPVTADADAPASVSVFVLRHAEKAEGGRDPALTAEGERRARALARLLSKAGVTHVYSSDYRRTRSTVEPVARTNELELTTYDPGGDALAGTLARLPAGSVAVVAGHSNTVPALVASLGGAVDELSERKHLAEDSYDRLFLVTLLVDPEGGAARHLETLELRHGE